MSYKEKIKRIEAARSDDELPLVVALNSIPGAKAWINPAKTGKDNQAGGDVKFQLNGENKVQSFEMQVSRKYRNFSYTRAKITKFVGEDDGPCWVVLGCVDEDGTGMFYCMIEATNLNNIILANGPHIYLGTTGEYYIIKPQAFINEKKWIGNSENEVVQEWYKDLSASAT